MDNVNEYKVLFDKAFTDIRVENEQLKTINLLVTGKSGVGKSTLINTVFGEELAKTGVGKPVTDKIHLIEEPGFPVRIYDTVGFELEKMGFDLKGIVKAFNKNDIQKLILDLQKTESPDDDIHAIWYLISGTSSRIEEAEIDFIKWLVSQHLPVIIGLTKSYDHSEAELLKKEIFKLVPDVKDIIIILAKETNSLRSFGVDELIDATFSSLPEGLQTSFVHSQEASVLLKRKEASKIVTLKMAQAFSQSWNLSSSHSVSLLSQQTSLIAEITTIYGTTISESQLQTIINSFLSFYKKIATTKNIAEKFSTILPSIGKIGSGLFSGTLNMVLVAAIGYAYIGLMEMLIKNSIDLDTIDSNELSDLLISILPKFLPQ